MFFRCIAFGVWLRYNGAMANEQNNSSANDRRTREPFRLQYCYGGRAGYRRGETFGVRVLADFEFVVILEGQVVYRCNGVDHPAPPGTVVLGRPGFAELYQWDRHRTTRHSFIHFNFVGGCDEWPDRDCWPIVCTSAPPVVPELIHYLIDFQPRWPGTNVPVPLQRAVITLLDAFLLGKTISSRRCEPLPPAVERTLTFVQQTLDETPMQPLTLDRLARQAKVCDKYLCKAFQQSLGTSPMRVVRQLRLERAMLWLIRSDLKISEIAQRCGFDNPYHFSRAFTECFGHPPSEVRRRVQAGEAPPVGAIVLP